MVRQAQGAREIRAGSALLYVEDPELPGNVADAVPASAGA